MAETKTKPTEVDVGAFIAAVPHAVRRADAEVVRTMMERLSGYPAVMWGPTIIGFGSVHYRYESGHEGDMPKVGFSPRKAGLVFYVGGYAEYDDDLAELGKHSRSKACLYVTKLADVDLAVVERIVARTLAAVEADPAGVAC